MVGFSVKSSVEKKRIAEIRDWLKVLLKNKYFEPCSDHLNLKKNEANRFCINCKEILCQRCCENAHSLHQIVQIRKYVYEDVVRIKDMNQFFNCAKIQHYVNNGSRVVYLNSRVGFKQLKPTGGPFCENCKRTLVEPHRYCSIACKLAVCKENAKDESDCLLFPVQNQELPGLYQDTESDTKEDDSLDSLHAEAEWQDGSPFLRPSKAKDRLAKRKGFACRAPFF